MLSRKVCGLVKVSGLTAHGYRNIKIKSQISRGFDKVLQLLYIFELGVAV